MCLSGSSSTTEQKQAASQQSATQSFAPWVASTGSSLYGNASGYAGANPYQGYSGPTTSAVTTPQTTAAGQLTANAGAPNANTVAAAKTIGGVANAINPNETIQSLMNPYVSATLQPTLQNLALAEGQTQQQTAAKTVLDGSYGGTAAGVQAAVNNNFYGQNVANATSQAESNAYNAATAQKSSDLSTLLNVGAAQNAVGAGQSAASTSAAGTLGSLGAAEQAIGQQGINTAVNVNNSNQMG